MTQEEQDLYFAERIIIEEQAYSRGYEDAKKEFERPHGEWEKKPEICYDYFYCSECGYAYKHAFNFCPNCGSNNRGEGEAE